MLPLPCAWGSAPPRWSHSGLHWRQPARPPAAMSLITTSAACCSRSGSRQSAHCWRCAARRTGSAGWSVPWVWWQPFPWQLTPPRSTWSGSWASRLRQWPGWPGPGTVWIVPGALAATFLLLLFPSGQLPSPRWRPVAWLSAAGLGLLTLSAAVDPAVLTDMLPATPNPLEPMGAPRVAAALQGAGAVVLFASMLASAAAFLLRLRHATGVERQQLKWFAYVCAMVVIGQVFGPVAQALGAQGNWVWVPLLLAIAGIPISIGVAVLRYRLYEIDRIINRTLVYGLLTAVLGVAYAGVVLTLGQLFGGLGAEPPSWAVAGATLAVATLFQPLRRRIQSAVDRRFNRRRYDAAKTIEAFSGRLREEVDLDTLSAELLAVVDQTMQPTQSSLWLRPSAQRSGRAVIIKRKLSPVGDNPSGPRTVCRLVSGYDLYASPE